MPTLSPPPPELSARHAGLHYVSDDRPGIRRRSSGSSFVYLTAKNTRLRDPKTLARIKSLVIPPAWTDVWICPDPQGHIQATGLDARKRKQYRYHPKWRETRDSNKFDRMCAFGKLLPGIRRKTAAHMSLPGLPREKALAAIVRLMAQTFMRVGNEEYARTNKHFGLTTLQDRHAAVRGSAIHFHFVGKSGVERTVDLHDPKLARIVKACRDLPGQDLFQYRAPDGSVHDITSTDVNDYLRRITKHDITAKDFRTWAGTLLAARALCAVKSLPSSQATAKRHLVSAIKQVAQELGNTPAVCKKCYIHPGVMESFVDGSLQRYFAAGSEEHGLLALLRRRIKAGA